MQKVFLSMPQLVYLSSMLTGSQLLQPVDFTLNGGSLALAPEPLDGPDAIEGRGRRRRRRGDTRDKLGIHST
jgi:hypothetical protein